MYNIVFEVTEYTSPFKNTTPMFKEVDLNGLFIDITGNLCQKTTDESYHSILDKDGRLKSMLYINILPTDLVKTILNTLNHGKHFNNIT